MKKLNYLSIIILLVIFSISCEKENQEIYELKGTTELIKGSLSLTFSELSVENQLKSTTRKKPALKYIVLSIKDYDGNYLLKTKRFELTQSDNGYFTTPIELEEGDYTIVDFFVMDSCNSTVFVTPKIHSEFAYLISTPLPHKFSVIPEQNTEIALDVILSSYGCAKKFGYEDFSFNSADELIIQPDALNGKDAVFSYLVPNNNYGDIQDIHLYTWTQNGALNINRVAIEFDLSKIPPNINIDSAFMDLYFNSDSPY